MDQRSTSRKRIPRHNYHQSLVYKAFLASKPGNVAMTLDQTLDVVKQLAELTGGIKQVVYLVGWQFDGHDSKYPAWSEVNHRLKRPGDADARDSLVWLMKEARKYNAFVSLHINMTDAYANSPLWQAYVDHDLIAKQSDGTLMKGAEWGGEMSYPICKPREWQSGYARKRIDALLAYLPLQESGTVHIDAFLPVASPGHRTTVEDELNAMVEILQYWRSQGIDVTTEDFDPHFAGLTPMVWHLNAEERTRLKFPPGVVCGGGSMWNARLGAEKRSDCPQLDRPEGGCLYEVAWGQSIDFDISSIEMIPVVAKEFFHKTLPWQFLNRSKPVSLTQTAEKYEVQWKNGVVTTVTHKDCSFTLRQGEVTYVKNKDLLVPAPWMDSPGGSQKTCIAYSEHGSSRTWRTPPEWAGAREASLKQLYPTGDSKVHRVPVVDNSIKLDIAPGVAIRVQAEIAK